MRINVRPVQKQPVNIEVMMFKYTMNNVGGTYYEIFR